VDGANGEIYVPDTNDYRVEAFTPNGAFVRAWGWGVADGTTHALQTCTRRCFAGLHGSGAGQFRFAEGIAVDNDPRSSSYGDVYVLDIFKHRVQKFSPTGAFLLMFGRGVNQTAGERHETSGEDICPVHAGDRCTEGMQGSGPGQLELPVEGHFLAVGADGTVYVGDRNRIQEFAANGTYESQVPISTPTAPAEGENGGVSGLEVNTAGDFYVIRIGVASVNEYNPSGRLLRTIDEQTEPEYPEGPTPVATIDAAGDVFVEHYTPQASYISELDPAGTQLATMSTPAQAGLHGMAYDNRTRQLYLVDATSGIARVLILAPPAPRPFAAEGELAARLIPGL